MLIRHRGLEPTIDPSAYVAPSATLVGDVRIAAGARILHGAVLTAEDGAVVIGVDTVVMENALVRGRQGHPAEIGSAVLIGPHAHVNGTQIEAMLSYYLTEDFSLGLGARYWSLWTTSGTDAFNKTLESRSDSYMLERYGVLVQATYKFD